MLLQLTVGAFLIAATVTVQAVFFGLASMILTRFGPWLVSPHPNRKFVGSLVAVVLWLMAGHSVGAWIWAFTFMGLGAFDALEPALYFSLVAYTTLGFGDVTLGADWRILSALAAANGLLIFGLSTAYLVEFMARLRSAQEA